MFLIRSVAVGVLGALLASCAPEPRCIDELFGGVVVDERVAIDCADVSRATRLARDLLEDSGMWPNVRTEVGGISLRVHYPDLPGDHLDAWKDGTVELGGSTDAFGNIETTPRMWSLVHELFHAKDIHDFNLAAVGNIHGGWAGNGRHALAEFNEFLLVGIVRCDNPGFPAPVLDALRAKGWGESLARLDAARLPRCP